MARHYPSVPIILVYGLPLYWVFSRLIDKHSQFTIVVSTHGNNEAYKVETSPPSQNFLKNNVLDILKFSVLVYSCHSQLSVVTGINYAAVS